MSERSQILSLPYIQPSQAQKHVTHNEAIQILDTLVHLSAKSRSETEPPAAPQDGDRYIPAPGAMLSWAGRDGDVAVFSAGTWQFYTPRAGWRSYIEESGEIVVHDGSEWGTAAPSALQNLTGIGVNGSWDATNRLSVSSAATLLSHDGAGHQLKINKNAASDTASLLFQSGWSGRAEMGLSGSDDFELKVSADGANWTTAMQIDAATGGIAFPGGGARDRLTGARTYHVDPVSGDDLATGRGTGSDAFATLSRAVSELSRIDAAGFDVTIKLADGTHALPGPATIDASALGAHIRLEGNPAAPGNVILDATGDGALIIEAAFATLTGYRLQSAGTGAAILARRNAHVVVSGVEFDATPGTHIEVDSARLLLDGGYSILGGVDIHVDCKSGGQVMSQPGTVDIAGTPDFTTSFCKADGGAVMTLSAQTYSGAATGIRYSATRNAIIDTGGGGGSYLPGDQTGSVATGGQYI